MQDAVVIDHETATIRPQFPEGDDFYGLTPWSAGTAAVTRRALVTPRGFAWRRHTGQRARGLDFQPSSMTPDAALNPWDGPRVSP